MSETTPTPRAYRFDFIGTDGKVCHVVIDSLTPAGASRNMAESCALRAVIKAKGSDWIDTFKYTAIY